MVTKTIEDTESDLTIDMSLCDICSNPVEDPVRYYNNPDISNAVERAVEKYPPAKTLPTGVSHTRKVYPESQIAGEIYRSLKDRYAKMEICGECNQSVRNNIGGLEQYTDMKPVKHVEEIDIELLIFVSFLTILLLSISEFLAFIVLLASNIAFYIHLRSDRFFGWLW